MYVFNDRTNLEDAIAKLKEKGVTLPWPRCGKLKFSIVGDCLANTKPEQVMFLNMRIKTHG